MVDRTTASKTVLNVSRPAASKTVVKPQRETTVNCTEASTMVVDDSRPALSVDADFGHQLIKLVSQILSAKCHSFVNSICTSDNILTHQIAARLRLLCPGCKV